MSVRILIGDVRDRLRELPDESVHCVVTSPPYWGLRDYGIAGQIGREDDFRDYIDTMVAVFGEVRRVLRSDGTLWLNLGDCYASSPPGNKATGIEKWKTSGLAGAKSAAYCDTLDRSVGQKRNTIVGGLKPKDLVGMPWRVAFALQSDGWWLRRDIIWSKPNPMPESVTDRPTTAHEYLFLLTKSARYFYDAEAIREPASDTGRDGRDEDERARPPGSSARTLARLNYAELGRNRRSVWNVPTAPFPEAHFATFPPNLIEPCILAGASEKGCCPECGVPWRRVTETEYKRHENWFGAKQSARHDRGAAGTSYNEPIAKHTAGWEPDCKCGGEPVPCTVLDPFGGAGTTGLVADRLGRDAILIELNPAYAEMARRRLEDDGGMFAEVEAA